MGDSILDHDAIREGGDSCEIRAQRDGELVAQGWQRRFIACEPRLSEVVELYNSLGYEVRLEPLPKEAQEGECRTCLEYDIDRYRIVYTRKRKDSEALEEELFED